MRHVVPLTILLVLSCTLSSCRSQTWPPDVQPMPEESPVLSPEEALKTFVAAPGFNLEIVASEPLIEDPVAIDIDADGRMWVVEMQSYMPNVEGEGELTPNGRVSVLEDVDGDGRMDRSTVFLDSLVLPRAVKALDHGILIAEPPYLWLARDTTGDLKADIQEAVRDTYGRRRSNPERNPNGLIWSIDNWLVSSYYDRRLRIDASGTWTEIPTLDQGQWGVTMDDYGRIYRNWNEDPLFVDLLPAYYYARNPNLERTRGADVNVVEDETVWPIRPTPGINRGYREGMLREDGTLREFTAAGSPVAFRGHRLPDDVVNDVFVSEPAGNLVRRFDVVVREDGSLQAHNAYDEGEFLASTDERFRPVNFYSAPDGTLYVVDMYRGIVQHRQYLTEYLEYQIEDRDLDRPVGIGRIYRVVHEDYDPDERPALSSMATEELVGVIEHPNGWWRDTAQRLLVERGDTSAAATLRHLAENSSDERVRLHALWTLDGLGCIDPSTIEASLQDASPHVRAAVVRITEGGSEGLQLLDDPHPVVYRQLSASLGELPDSLRLDAVEKLLVRRGNDEVTVDAALSGMHGFERELLERLLRRDDELLLDAVAMSAAAALHGGDEAVLALLEGLSERQQRALMEGILAFVPTPPGREQEWTDFETYELSAPPDALLTIAGARNDSLSDMAERAARGFSWPGKPPMNRPDVPPLTSEEQGRYDRGHEMYDVSCAVCHGEDGMARSMDGVPLVGSEWVVGSEDALIRIILHGKEGEGLMPPMRSLNDDEVAAILTYVRRSWGNRASAVDPDEVREVRGRTAFRSRPWTEEELTE